MKPLLTSLRESNTVLRKEAEYTKCKECGNQIKKTRHNRLFCNNSCRVKHHLKMKEKRVMLLSKEEYEVIMEMRRKNGEEAPGSIKKVKKIVNTPDHRMNECLKDRDGDIRNTVFLNK